MRNKLRTRLEEMERSNTEEEETAEKMNEEKMINALDSNVKLGCLQAVFEKVISGDMSHDISRYPLILIVGRLGLGLCDVP